MQVAVSDVDAAATGAAETISARVARIRAIRFKSFSYILYFNTSVTICQILVGTQGNDPCQPIDNCFTDSPASLAEYGPIGQSGRIRTYVLFDPNEEVWPD